VDAVCTDPETAPIPEREKALWRWLARLNDAPASVGEADVLALKALGWSERELYDAATVCAMFNFFNRWIEAAGVRPVAPGFYASRLAQHGDMGYRM
jgi:alkylhydroperoxidase family enzyme